MDLNLRDNVIAIAGGTDGLGLALARLLLDERARVAVCGRDPERLATAQATLGEGALCVPCDVTDVDQLDAFLATTVATFGRLDGLVNNAGRSSASPVTTSTDAQWYEDFDLKVMAAVRASRRAFPLLADSNGVILNVLAIAARAPEAGSTPTSATRAAGLALTKALAYEGGPLGIRVNALLVGKIRSGQWARRAAADGVSEDAFYETSALREVIPLGRFGDAEEFAAVAAFFLSSRASYVTGVGISVDGGLSPVI